MKTKQVFFMVLSLILLTGVMSVDAADRDISPANLPWIKEYIEWGNNRGTHVSIAHHPTNGRAYISYYDSSNKDLMLAYELSTPGSGDCGPNNDWRCVVVDSVGDVGQYSSIDVVYISGSLLNYTKVGISYYDATNGALKYAQIRYPLPGTWTITTIDQRVYVNYEFRGTYSSLKFNADANPVIGYHADGNTIVDYGAVKVASYVPTGDSGVNCNSETLYWECQTVDRVDGDGYQDHGSHVSVDFSYGNSFYIAFFNSELNSLDYAWYQAFGGSCSNTAWNCITVDDGADRGKFISFHAPDNASDKIQLAYFDDFNDRLKYAYYVGSGGNCSSSTFNCYWVDSGMISGEIAMEMDAQGYPVIAYIKADSEFGPAGIKIARPPHVYGLLDGNCGQIPTGYLFPIWQCNSVDNMHEGLGWTNAAGYLDLSVNSAGLVKIAYAENDDYEYSIHLKLARQEFSVFLPIVLK